MPRYLYTFILLHKPMYIYLLYSFLWIIFGFCVHRTTVNCFYSICALNTFCFRILAFYTSTRFIVFSLLSLKLRDAPTKPFVLLSNLIKDGYLLLILVIFFTWTYSQRSLALTSSFPSAYSSIRWSKLAIDAIGVLYFLHSL